MRRTLGLAIIILGLSALAGLAQSPTALTPKEAARMQAFEALFGGDREKSKPAAAPAASAVRPRRAKRGPVAPAPKPASSVAPAPLFSGPR